MLLKASPYPSTMKKIVLIALFVIAHTATIAQSRFPYDIQLTPITIAKLPGLHSYAFAQHEGKWLIVGGRKDGIHARQPFNSFPNEHNNTDIYVVDVATKQFWSASVTTLPTGLKEQLQSTNMNFHQDGNTLYIIGGYAYSEAAADHITFDKLTSIAVPELINAIISGNSITPYFKQLADPIFQNTGGQLGKIGNDFYLVGGQIFTGRYNPMNHPTFEQTYLSNIQKFTIDNSGPSLRFANYTAMYDGVHLHRRDFNLVPQVFPDGAEGYTLSSGVFQINDDLPFLYPVDLKRDGYVAQTQFSQYLSNYHSGKVGLFDLATHTMHSLFFGGISQYYYDGTTLVQDDNVPFVKTISRVTRLSDGSLTEHKFDTSMPNLKGAGAEFIPNTQLAHYSNEVIELNDIKAPEFVIGHLYGGIQSAIKDAFTTNQTDETTSDPTIYEVKLVYNPNIKNAALDGKNPFTFSVIPHSIQDNQVRIEFELPYSTTVDYFITSLDGKILDDGELEDLQVGTNKMHFSIENAPGTIVLITFIFDHKFYITQQVIRD